MTKPESKMKPKKTTARKVLVTTIHRGVFFGALTEKNGNAVVLENARCAIYWATTYGFLELAKVGPNSKSKIGATAPRIELFDVTSISDVTPAAANAWESFSEK